jgi:hypothetical protein
MLVLKHLHDWSFEECEREVPGHFRLAHLLDEPVLKDVLARLVALGLEGRFLRGRRLRVDTTVVETNIHYPTDASPRATAFASSRARCVRRASTSTSARAVSRGRCSRSPSGPDPRARPSARAAKPG